MWDQLRDEITVYLRAHAVGVLSTAGSEGAWAMPVRYRPSAERDLAVECLLPAWADVTYFLERDPRALLIVPEIDAPPLRWLQMQGTAQTVASPSWDDFLPVPPLEGQYRVVRLTPRRFDLFDEGRGWGARETLDI